MFHGHGGSAKRCMSRFHAEQAWREAVVVYPEGLPITLGDPTKNDLDWMLECKDSNCDIQLFDDLRSRVLEEFHADPTKVYAWGFSNGGMFMYSLWTLRPDKIAAFCRPAPASLLQRRA